MPDWPCHNYYCRVITARIGHKRPGGDGRTKSKKRSDCSITFCNCRFWHFRSGDLTELSLYRNVDGRSQQMPGTCPTGPSRARAAASAKSGAAVGMVGQVVLGYAAVNCAIGLYITGLLCIRRGNGINYSWRFILASPMSKRYKNHTTCNAEGCLQPSCLMLLNDLKV